ncbi:MAG: hypothetical protein RLZZ77_822 [Bacteroidota bacterium]|jgi:aldehyde dehydrogenase (NAD+)
MIDLFELQKQHCRLTAQSSARDRKRKLTLLKQAIGRFRPQIQEALYQDYRKSSTEVDLIEIFATVQEIQYAIDHLSKWMEPEMVSIPLTQLGAKSYILPEAKGVCLIIAPWNFPITLTLGPLASAIAAGNTAIIKPSEFTPHINAVIKQLLAEVFDEKEVAVVEGDQIVSTQLLELPFDHIFFTGSPAVGKVVMAAAAKHLTSCTLELGGKSPVIVDSSAHLDSAAERIVAAKFSNAGQICIAPDYIYVHASLFDAFQKKLIHYIEKFYGNTDQERIKSDYTRIVNQRHHNRLSENLTDAQAKGAQVVFGGHREENYFSPTLLTKVTDDMRVMQEEIFGPLLPLIPFTDREEIVRAIQSQPKPLACYVFAAGHQLKKWYEQQLSAGGLLFNDAALHFLNPALPFGGIGNSGLGKAHGYFGFLEFSHRKSVMHVPQRWSIASIIYPPFSEGKKKWIGKILRFLTR